VVCTLEIAVVVRCDWPPGGQRRRARSWQLLTAVDEPEAIGAYPALVNRLIPLHCQRRRPHQGGRSAEHWHPRDWWRCHHAAVASLNQRLLALDNWALAAPQRTRERLRSWRARPTVRQQLREACESDDFWVERDARLNDETRLPDDQRVGCVGLMLVEAVTPSTLAMFKRRRAELPIKRDTEDGSRTQDASRTRGGSWTNLGLLRRPGEFILHSSRAGHDPSLPEFVTGVHIGLHQVGASVGMLVATFVFSDDAGDLSQLMRADYATSNINIRVSARGVGRFTRRLPWARPLIGIGYRIVDASDAKSRAVDVQLEEWRATCRQWLTRTLPGRFALEPGDAMPSVTMLVTDGVTPYDESAPQLRPLGLQGPRFGVWTSPEERGWSGSLERMAGERHSKTLWAARRDELPGSRDSNTDEDARRNWIVGYRFHEAHARLFSLWGLWRLLHVYESSLATYRDSAAVGARRRARPIKQARALDRLLTTDGMDAATVCHDITQELEDVRYLRHAAPEYIETHDWLPQKPPPQLLDGLHRNLQYLAQRLPQRFEVVLANARASAELRQAMSNTRLQRWILPVSAVALIIAIYGLLDGGSGDGTPLERFPSPSSTATVRPKVAPPKVGAPTSHGNMGATSPATTPSGHVAVRKTP
jgi:hypothetical protein